MGIEISDIVGLKEPITKFIEVCSVGLGKITEPYLIKRKADARAYEIKTITQSLSESQKILSSKSDYKNGEIQIMISEESSKDLISSLNESSLEQSSLIQNDIKDRILYQQLKREKNIYNTLNYTMNELETEISENISEEKVDEDWITRFFNTIEDINNEHLQQLWAKILAGEIKQPNTYSLRTLELLKNLSFKEAELFSKIGNLSIQNYTKTSTFIPSDKKMLEKLNINFSDILLLQDLNLIHPQELSFDIKKQEKDIHTFLFYGKELIKIDLKKDIPMNLPIYSFTSIGKELINLVERTSNNDYKQEISKLIKKDTQMKVYSTLLLNNTDSYNPLSFTEI